ncbi:hypothetical protein I5I01_gp74 [Mycobacterium phage MooMoo]|uniref:Uncharacterized protein n=1 Tax=Mycobacterium phage MooMoo TaxID=2108127 RepID=A0A2P1JRA7_9CAUD|nr:hypothetical protein I5I01_gp74 [Mycobacterium phage MooMoo]AVO21679.1 hypothetical protein SEA_MOOMOO_74 [Mycobacterium phage MooMoo]
MSDPVVEAARRALDGMPTLAEQAEEQPILKALVLDVGAAAAREALKPIRDWMAEIDSEDMIPGHAIIAALAPLIYSSEELSGESDAAERARELLAQITPWPWVAEYSKEQGNCVIPADAQSTREAVCVTRLYHQVADAEFIAAAPELVSELVAEVERKSAQLAEWRAQYDALDAENERLRAVHADLLPESKVIGSRTLTRYTTPWKDTTK